MSRLSPKGTKKIDLGDEEYIEIRSSMSFEELSEVVSNMTGASDAKDVRSQLKGVLELAEKAVVGWRLKDDEGINIPFDAARIKDLDFRTMILLQKEIEELYQPEKKD